jgi:hypothetical protein
MKITPTTQWQDISPWVVDKLNQWRIQLEGAKWNEVDKLQGKIDAFKTLLIQDIIDGKRLLSIGPLKDN